MRSRQEIKYYAKYAFKAQRSNSVLALFLVGLIPVGLMILVYIPIIVANFSQTANIFSTTMMMTTGLIGLFIWVVYALALLLLLVLHVNLSGLFTKVYYGQPISYSEPFAAIKYNFGRKLGGMCWEALWIYLWSLAFIVPGAILITILATFLVFQSSYGIASPGMLMLIYVMMIPIYIPLIIKMLQYSMTSFILACNPNVTATNALKLSIRMTKGHKGEIFMMGLSFLGWWLLSSLTLHILGILYVFPYTCTSFAGLFVEMRNKAVATGAIHPAELDGMDAYYPQYQQYPQQHQFPYLQQYLQHQPPPIPLPPQQPPTPTPPVQPDNDMT